MSTLKFKRLHPDAQLPTRGSAFAAGYDLYSVDELTLHPGQRAPISTGIAVAIPEGHYGRIAPRSGLAVKSGVALLAGVVDIDYRGEVKAVLVNLDPIAPLKIRKGDRIAQLLLEAITTPTPEWVSELPETGRGENGFGSSGR